VKERLVILICNEEDMDGRIRVTTDEERVVYRLNRDQLLQVVRLAGCENFVGE